MNFISENQLEEWLNNELDFLFILTMDGNILEMNSAVYSILGYPEAEVKGKNLAVVYPPQYKEKMMVTVPLAIKGTITSSPYPFITKTSEIIPVDTKFYVGWWKGKNVVAAVCTNLSTEYFSKGVFFSLFNNSRIMMVISTADSGIIFNANQAFMETIGYSLEEIAGKSSRELGLFYDYSEREAVLQQFKKKGKAEGEITIKTKSGTLITCLFSLEGIEIQKNTYLLYAATDITQRKKTEEKLKYLNQQQKLLADVAQFLNKSGNFDDIINTVLKMVGEHSNVSRVYIFENTTDEQFTSNTHEWCNKGIEGKKEELQMLPFDKVPSWKKILNREGRIFSENIQELPQDIIDVLEPMQIKSILVYPLYLENHLWGFVGFDECLRNKIWTEDEINLLLTVTNNIANALERKKYLEQSVEREMRLRLALSGAKEGIWEWNLQSGEIYFTDTCYTMLGYEPDNPIAQGYNWKELIHPDDFENVLKIFEKHSKGAIDYYESVFRIKDSSGKWKWILDHGKIIEWDKNNKAVRAIGTHIDITQQKETELQLQELLATKDKLFSIISHDLRGPIGSFMQVIELLTSDIHIDSDEQITLLNQLKDMSQGTFYLLENLLNWSRSQRSEITYAPRLFIINELVNESISLLSATAGQKSIEIQFECQANYSVYADFDMINLIFRNLLSNAIKFTRQGGLIRIRIYEQKDYILTEITDNGIGISRDVADKLFTKNQFHSTYGTNNEKGTGLGLALCTDFVQRNNGTIGVESTPGKGSKFTFTVPANK